jgi:hypothetical protein
LAEKIIALITFVAPQPFPSQIGSHEVFDIGIVG